MSRGLQLTLRAKIVFLVCAAVLCGTLAVAYFNGLRIEKIAIKRANDALISETQTLTVRLESDFIQSLEDAKLVSYTPPIKGLIRSMHNGDVDPLDGSTTELWRARLATIFSSVMDSRPAYFQMRYIGLEEGGREIVRVNRNGDSLEIVPETGLQKKGDEPYVLKGSQLAAGRSSFSQVSLNRELGAIESDRIPTIRSLVPVYSDTGEIFGLIVINVDYSKLIGSAIKRIKPGYDTYVVNSSGDTFTYDRNTQDMHFDFAEDAPKDVHEYWQQISLEKDSLVHRSGDVIMYNFPMLKYQLSERFALDVILSASEAELFTDVEAAKNESTLLALILVVVSVAVTAICANIMTRPLRNMTTKVSDFAVSVKGDKLLLPIDKSDEIGALSRAFTKLVANLQDSEARSKNIISHAVDGLIVINEYGEVETFNPACEKLFGYDAHEVVGQNIKMLMPDGDRQQHDGYLSNFKTTGEAKIIGVGREVRAQRKSGETFMIGLSLSEVEQSGRKFYCGIIRDLTQVIAAREALAAQRIELAQQKETLEFALKGGELGYWEWDLVTGDTGCSARCAEFIGLSASEDPDYHLTWWEYIDPEDRDRVDRTLREFAVGKIDKFQIEFRMRHVDGTWVWVQSKALISKQDEQGRTLKIVGIHSDITERKKTEIETLEKNRQLELAEAVADMGHWSVDGENQTVYWSDGVYKIHGLTPEEHTPDLTSGIEFYHPDDQELVNARVADAIELGKPFEFSLRIVRRNGEIRHVHSKGDVIRDERGVATGSIFGIFQDVTDQVVQEQRLAESEEKNRTVLENIVDGVITMDIDGNIDSCNPACARIFGYTVEEFTGLHVKDIVTEAARLEKLNGFPRSMKVPPSENKLVGQTIELDGVRKNGEVFIVELAISRLELGGKFYFTGVLRDITQRKQVEVMKNEFVSTVNHELRTPLTSIYGSLDLLKRMSAGQLDPKCLRLVELAHDGCGRLANLVNDILDLEKIAAGKMEYRKEVTELKALVQDVVSRHEPLADRFNVQFDVEQNIDGVLVSLDPDRFNQALVNLLSNAAKFSPADGVVKVTTGPAADGQVRISVKDDGPGIPESFQSRIFEKFAQADATSKRKIAGTGLGLSITKSIIESFDGKVSFDSSATEGTVFHFDLPVLEQARLAG